jgi:IS4 transposase
VAVDGTFLHAVAEVAWSVANSNNHGTTRHLARLDAQLNVFTWLPEAIVVPEPGESEADSAIKNILADRIYVYDRGYSSFALLRAHYRQEEATQDESSQVEETFEVKSHFVVRYKPEGSNSPALSEATDRRLTEEDRAAGVLSDRVGYFASAAAQREGIWKIPLREVIIPYEENGEPKTLRLITNLLDVSAQTIALLYQSRWQVELFFRWLKSIGHFGHLISHSSAGVRTHLYVTIIGVLLMYLHTGYRPSKYMFALLSQVAAGAATLEETLPILRERERRKELDRASAARRRAKKQAASQ